MQPRKNQEVKKKSTALRPKGHPIKLNPDPIIKSPQSHLYRTQKIKINKTCKTNKNINSLNKKNNFLCQFVPSQTTRTAPVPWSPPRCFAEAKVRREFENWFAGLRGRLPEGCWLSKKKWCRCLVANHFCVAWWLFSFFFLCFHANVELVDSVDVVLIVFLLLWMLWLRAYGSCFVRLCGAMRSHWRHAEKGPSGKLPA